MPQQTSGVILRPDLYELAKDFDRVAAMRGFVGLQIMPAKSVMAQSGPFPKMTAKELMRTGTTERAPRAGYGRGFSYFGSDDYTCKEYGWEEAVDHSYEKIFGNWVKGEQEATLKCAQVLEQGQEVRIRDVIYAQTAHAVGTAWSTAATATPQDDIRDAQNSVELDVGVKPNALVLTRTKMQDVLKTAEFLDYSKYTFNSTLLSESAQIEAVRAFFDLEELHIATGVYDSAAEGLAFSGARIWTDTKGFLYVKGSDIMGGPKFGLTLNWADDSLVGTESYEEVQTRSTIIRARNWRTEKVMLAAAGWQLTNL